MTKLVVGRDQNSTPDWVIDFTTSGRRAVFTAGQSSSLTIPADVTKISVQATPGAEVWIGKNVAPAAPGSGTTFEASGGTEILPALRNVAESDVIHVLAVDAANVNIVFYE